MPWNIDHTQFTEQLLAFWVDKGFGNASKKDLEAYALHLLVTQGHYQFPQDLYRAARELRISETRLRNLYQHMQLLYGAYSDQLARREWAQLVEQGQFEVNGTRVTFIVREPMLRQYLEEWVAAVNGFTDSSFNRSLVVMGSDTLERVLDHLRGDCNIKLPSGYEHAKAAAKKEHKTLTRYFVEEFVKGAGNASGQEAVALLKAGFKAFVLC